MGTGGQGTPRPDGLSARCAGCGSELWKQRRGEWTLRNRILKLASGGALTAKCADCGGMVDVPFLRLTEPAQRPRRRLVVPRER